MIPGAVIAFAFLAGTTGPQNAAEVSAAARQEAESHRTRALQFKKEGDIEKAHAEFLAGDKVWPHPIFRIELASICHVRDEPVQALEHIQEALAHKERLSLQEDRDRAQSLKQLIERKLGSVAVTVEPAGTPARIFVAERRYTPPAPVPAKIGTNVVRVEADGFQWASTEVVVASGPTTVVKLTLVPVVTQVTKALLPGHIRIEKATSHAYVVIDDVHVGVTPLPAAVDVTPGPHNVRLSRPGYAPWNRSIYVPAGATQVVSDAGLRPLEMGGGVFEVLVEPDGARVDVDDGTFKRHGNGPLRTPLGEHRLRFSKPYFEERVVQGFTRADAPTTLRFALAPTPALVERRAARTNALWWALGGGAVAAGAALAVALDAGARQQARDQLAEVERSFTWGGGGACDYMDAVDHMACDNRLADARHSARVHDVVFYGGLGLAAAGVVVAGLGLWRAHVNADPVDDGTEPKDKDMPMTITLIPGPRGVAAALAVRLP